jgi:predicted regulator of Ras-like GTPase activity (Roadblock/LC7/MglB family)
MARTDSEVDRPGSGFGGEVAGMGLADVLQVNAHNRFSGSLRVRNGEQSGVVYFHDGDIVHAEQGARVGEVGLIEILQWKQGHFIVEQNVVSARRTINKSCEHLLLEAHRQLDERTAGRGEAPPAPAAAARQPGTATDLIRSIPGVTGAVLSTGDGQCLGEKGHAAETLAGQTAYLIMFCDEFGSLFGTGELRSAGVEGSDQHMLLYASKARRYLGVFARADADVKVVDVAIRGLLTKGH